MTNTEQALASARTYQQTGDLAQAEEVYRQILQANPSLVDVWCYLGATCQQRGKLDEAVASYGRALQLRPGYVEVYHNLGLALIQLDKLEEAVAVCCEAVQQQPNSAIACYDLGHALALQGKVEEARACLVQALRRKPNFADAHNDLGDLFKGQGRMAEAAACYQRALQASPDLMEAHFGLGVALLSQGKAAEAVGCLQRAIQLQPSCAEAHGSLGVALASLGQADPAIACLQECLRLRPENSTYRLQLRTMYTAELPRWHFPMLNDRARNNAYEQAIRKAVRPESQVLDIGAGSGLLAMMAARAGAHSVTTCEALGFLAAKAQEIIAVNGFKDRIRVVAKRSTDLVIGIDMPEKADVLITETFSSNLLGEDVLDTITHAHAVLIKPGARIIPRAAAIKAYLVGGQSLYEQTFVGDAAGFDVSAFNAFAPYRRDVHVTPDHQVMSAEVDVYSFDFYQSQFPAEPRILDIRVTQSGLCLGLLQWIKLDLDEEIAFENHPRLGAVTSGWVHNLLPFAEPVNVVAGQTVQISVQRDGRRVYHELVKIAD